MTLYTRKTFTVPASSTNKPKDCTHSWRDSRNKCVLCGEDPEENDGEKTPKALP